MEELDEKARELLELEKKVAARRDALDEFVDENVDGTHSVSLVSPVTLDGKTVAKVTLRRVKVRDVLQVGRGDDNFVRLKDLAPLLAEPAGIVDELELSADYEAVLYAAERALGKYQSGGRSSSQSPSTDSAGRGATS